MKSIRIDRSKCIYCGACAGVCPVLAMRLTDNGLINDKEKCTRCGICVKACPAAALALEEE